MSQRRRLCDGARWGCAKAGFEGDIRANRQQENNHQGPQYLGAECRYQQRARGRADESQWDSIGHQLAVDLLANIRGSEHARSSRRSSKNRCEFVRRHCRGFGGRGCDDQNEGDKDEATAADDGINQAGDEGSYCEEGNCLGRKVG